MKLIAAFCVIAIAMSASQASLLHEIAESGFETVINSVVKMINNKQVSNEQILLTNAPPTPSPTPTTSTYQMIRNFVGCDSGVSALADTVFTVIDLGESDSWSWQVVLFGLLYLYSWYQQNFAMVQQECMALYNSF